MAVATKSMQFPAIITLEFIFHKASRGTLKKMIVVMTNMITSGKKALNIVCRRGLLQCKCGLDHHRLV
jgi:hypothetical protein